MILLGYDVNVGLLIALSISECISIYFIVRIWLSHDYLLIKVFASGVVAIPFLGPVIYHWIYTAPPRLSEPEIDAKFMPRGDFARGWLGGGRASLEKKILELEKEVQGNGDENNGGQN